MGTSYSAPPDFYHNPATAISLAQKDVEEEDACLDNMCDMDDSEEEGEQQQEQVATDDPGAVPDANQDSMERVFVRLDSDKRGRETQDEALPRSTK